MAYLNEQEREDLANELAKKPFVQAKGRVRRMDRSAHMEYYRNVQNVDEWMTRYTLPKLGVIVTLIETYGGSSGDPSTRREADFELSEVIVEPTPGNRT